jgi:hypothetical protein
MAMRKLPAASDSTVAVIAGWGQTPDLPILDNARQFKMLIDCVVDCALYVLDPAGVITSWNAGA